MIMTVLVGNKMIPDTDTCLEQINKQIENNREFSWSRKTQRILIKVFKTKKKLKNIFDMKLISPNIQPVMLLYAQFYKSEIKKNSFLVTNVKTRLLCFRFLS